MVGGQYIDSPMSLLPPARSRAQSGWQWLAGRLGLGSLCLVCGQWQADALCAGCRQAWAPAVQRCRCCAIELPAASGEICGDCLRAPPPFSRALAAVNYAYPWDRLVLSLKFGVAAELAAPLSELLSVEVSRAVQSDGLELPQWLLPVPLSEPRLRERGHNQAWELARRLARRHGLQASADLLLRVRDTPHQLALPRALRETNVHGAFACSPAARALLAGCTVALVDDVMTTGATLAEASHTLLRAGAEQVQVWVVARTP
jgi:ComF family protein